MTKYYCHHCCDEIIITNDKKIMCGNCGEYNKFFDLIKNLKKYSHVFTIMVFITALMVLVNNSIDSMLITKIDMKQDLIFIKLSLIVSVMSLILLFIILILIKLSDDYELSPFIRLRFPILQKGFIEYYIFIISFLSIYILSIIYLINTFKSSSISIFTNITVEILFRVLIWFGIFLITSFILNQVLKKNKQL
jgi:hypothetical protein